MIPFKIGVVSYLNTIPLKYGLEQQFEMKNYQIITAVPSLLPTLLLQKEVDIAIVPSGSLHTLPSYSLQSRYCLGSEGRVNSVLLLSNSSLSSLHTIYLDLDSMSSVRLVKILCQHYWNISPKFVDATIDDSLQLSEGEAMVAIGDKTFALSKSYKVVADLSLEWKRFTGLPFVFAVWASLHPMEETTIQALDSACAFGLAHIEEAVASLGEKIIDTPSAIDYLTNSMNYLFDEDKKEALKKFLAYSSMI